ncbi:hypothetical protein ACI3PL_31890, partial [Lacticaseibacillus paracasei]
IRTAKTNIDIESGNTFFMEEEAEPIEVLKEYIVTRNLQGVEEDSEIEEQTDFEYRLNNLPKLTTVADVLKNQYQSKP